MCPFADNRLQIEPESSWNAWNTDAFQPFLSVWYSKAWLLLHSFLSIPSFVRPFLFLVERSIFQTYVPLQLFWNWKCHFFMPAQPKADRFAEMKNGEKVSHWIWYVFSQFQGLCWCGTTAYFSIRDLVKAINYYEHPIFEARFKQIISELLNIESNDHIVQCN